MHALRERVAEKERGVEFVDVLVDGLPCLYSLSIRFVFVADDLCKAVFALYFTDENGHS